MASYTIFAVLLLASTAAFASAGLADCKCPRIFRPVCNKATGVRRDNLCVATECFGENVNDLVPGRCCEDHGCPMNYAPVCGDGVTYGNLCEAECSGARSLVPGECGTFICACPMNEDPVCGSDGIMYANACAAGCGGASVGSADNCAVPYGGYKK